MILNRLVEIRFHPKRPAEAPGALYRALRDDVAHPFVEIAPGGDDEIVHEEGEPDGAGGAVLIAEVDELLPFAGRQGHLGTRLYGDGARLVQLTRWSSPLMYARAVPDAELRHALYQPVED